MLYNIDFALAGLIFLFVLYVFLRIQYNQEMPTVIQLRRLMLCLIGAVTADIVTAITISYPDYVPLWVNYLLNVMFFEFDVICIAQFPKYIRAILSKDVKTSAVADRINDIIIWSFAILCASTPFTHAIFYFDAEKKYCHGTLYITIFLVPLYLLIFSLVRLMLNKKHFTKRQFYSIIGFIVFALCGPGLQMTLPGNYIIDFYALSLAAFIIVFGLETPDFLKLEKTLAELNESQQALKEALKKAEDADKAKSIFLANMSHEIRTPINAVLGMNELIGRESTEENIQEYSANVADAGNSLLSLINDILDFSKIEAGHMELVPSNYELAALLREINNIVSQRCKDKGLDFSINVNPDTPSGLYGDEVRIRQVLVNIIGNAIKYTDKGSVTLEVSSLPSEAGGITLVFATRDTGIGIREEDLPKLFDSFKRIDPEHTRMREGTGLGLSITRSFVNLMEGSIEVDSKYGQGSVFIVKIPQTVWNDSKIGTLNQKAAGPKRGKYESAFTAPAARILVVDDVAINLAVMKGLLKPTEILVDTASSGPACLEAIRDTHYDMILLDHMMPEMDGIETMQRISADSTHANTDTPIIMLTANAIIGSREEYLGQGFTDYLSKPVHPEELEALLTRHLPEEKVIYKQ